jgi:hypothetical protein
MPQIPQLEPAITLTAREYRHNPYIYPTPYLQVELNPAHVMNYYARAIQ